MNSAPGWCVRRVWPNAAAQASGSIRPCHQVSWNAQGRLKLHVSKGRVILPAWPLADTHLHYDPHHFLSPSLTRITDSYMSVSQGQGPLFTYSHFPGVLDAQHLEFSLTRGWKEAEGTFHYKSWKGKRLNCDLPTPTHGAGTCHGPD